MAMEGAAGKNPVTHVGKLYNVAATRMSARLVRELAGITDVRCVLVGQIGRPIDDPEQVDISLELKHGANEMSGIPAVGAIVRDELGHFAELQAELMAGRIRVY